MCLETDNESDDEPQLTINDVIDVIHRRFPAMNFNQYLNALCRQGITYLTAAANFDSDFYVRDVGMSRGAASVFCRQVTKMKKKDARVAVQSEANRTKRARTSDNDEDAHNN